MIRSIRPLIELALNEDIGPGDITTDSLIPAEKEGRGWIVAKQSLMIAGLDVAREVFHQLDPDVMFNAKCRDGDRVDKGTTVVDMTGRLRTLLKGERTALNFLQRLSGIATHVSAFMANLDNQNVRLVDTRKTTPGWRILEKYAVRVGGGSNHRMGLYDGVLIKDNHIAACGGISKAVTQVRRHISHLVKIEVEVENLDQVKEALSSGADVIMLDNMGVEKIREAVNVIDGRALVEVSGMVQQKDIKRLADTGVDIISAGALTHSAVAVDLSMRIE